jgi:type I restriction enzyme M protein
MAPKSFQDLSNFIWSVADLLRGPYRPPQYERVMLPMTVLRRFDCVLEPTKAKVVRRHEQIKEGKNKNLDPILNTVAGDGKDLGFHNHSKIDFQILKGDPDHVGRHLQNYIDGFSANVQKIFERFDFTKEIEKLEESNRLYAVVSKFAEIDLHPRYLDNITMGLVFEDLIRRFNESANETAGDHFTPREVIRLMVNLILEPDEHILTTGGVIATICDPACGTGGMLSEAQNWIREHNESARVIAFGQDYNPRSYAVAASDLLIKGHKDSRVEFGNTLTEDRYSGERFDYLLANPPFGVDWKEEQKILSKCANFRGYSGKLPRVNDGALLFLLHMIGHFEEVNPAEKKHGSRCAIVFNGSPLFTGGAGSGESDIRRWIIERDMLEAIVALPDQMFYNTGIGTFIWVVTNRKEKKRRGKIQLIDARERWSPMRRSLGDKRRYLTDETIAALTKEHGKFGESETSKLFDNTDFGYRRVTIERPVRLRFQITREAKASFLDACSEQLDAIEAIEATLGPEAMDDWNEVEADVQRVLRAEGVKWTAREKKLFREAFTTIESTAQPVIASEKKASADDPGPDYGSFPHPDKKSALHVRYEPDSKLRDAENVPLKENIQAYFLREVRPFVADAWIDADSTDEQDGRIGKVGYEINFNRVFFKYQPPRPLKVIDAELDAVEKRILKLLREVTE